MAAYGNIQTPSDSGGALALGSNAGLDSFFNKVNKGFNISLKLMLQMEKSANNIAKSLGSVGKNGSNTGSGNIGMGTMPNVPYTTAEKVAGGIAAVATVGSIGMGMMPSTMNAVTQRMTADTFAGLSGMSAMQAMQAANKAVGNGATSATGPIQAMATAAYSGGYLANTMSSKNIMGAVGGLSALTGGSNQQVAAGLSGINGMNFLRVGVTARNPDGSLKPINDIINGVYNFLYSGKTVTLDQAQMVYNPNSKGYNTIAQIAGGNPDLMASIQAGIVARASKGSGLSKSDLSGSTSALGLMKVGAGSPLAAQFNYNTSTSNVTTAMSGGLVSGYNTSLNTAASINNGMAGLANTLPGVVDLFGKLKGVLETFPGLDGPGGTISTLVGSGMGLGYGALQNRALSQMLSSQNNPVAAAENFPGQGYTVGGVGAARGGAGIAGRLGKAGGLASLAALAALLKGGLDNTGLAKNNTVKKVGNVAADMGIDALIGASIGSILPGPGTAIGAVLGTGAGLIQGLFQGGNAAPGMGTAASSGSPEISYPTSKHSVSSGFGKRRDPHNPSKWTSHTGIDYAVLTRTPVHAAADGVVSYTGLDKDYGNYVIITHGKKSTLYAHLSQIKVHSGQKIRKGEEIGLSGGKPGTPGAGNSTGPHLHFELRDNGGVGAQGRVDPSKYIGAGSSKFSPPLPTAMGAPAKGANNKSVSIDTISDPGILNSVGLPSQLASAMMAGNPLSYGDMLSTLGNNSKLSATDGTPLIDSTINVVPGDVKGMPGGSRGAYMRMLYAQGFRGKALSTAFAVSLAESQGRPNAIGDVKLEDSKWGPSVGLFQIRSLKDWKKWNDPDRDASRLQSPTYNIKAAWDKSNHGTNWSAWSTYTGGEFSKYLYDAQVTAKSDGYGVGGSSAPSMSLAEVGESKGAYGMPTSTSFNANQQVNIKVQMNVNIATASVQGANDMVNEFNRQLHQQLRRKGIASV
jgi:hypothetical protein